MIKIKLDHVELEIDNLENGLVDKTISKQLESALELNRLVISRLDIPYPFLTSKEKLKDLVAIVHRGLVEIIVPEAKRTEKIALVLYAYNPLPVPLRKISMSVHEPISVVKNYLNNDPYRDYVIYDKFDMVSLTTKGVNWILETILPRFIVQSNSENQE